MPDRFLLGASISGHQVDGGKYDQWTAWENFVAEELAAQAEADYSHLPIWEDIKNEATDPANYIAGSGVKHHQHYKEDLRLGKDMGLNAIRFSIEWASLEPEEGKWSESGFEFYERYFDELELLELIPVVTLWHWTHPHWFEAKGGFTLKQNFAYFERFASKVIERFGHRIKWLSVLNEPNTYTGESFLLGEWPPGKRSARLSRKVYRHLTTVHRRVYRLVKQAYPDIMVGSTFLLNNVQPKRPRNIIDRLMAHWYRLWWNWWFIEQIRWQIDFIGMNYYFTDYIKNFRRSNPPMPINDMGWYMEPSGLEQVLYRARLHFKKPIVVMETGVADRHDKWRGWWIEETLAAVKRAQARGIDVRGYLMWSLLDNFEWSSGWWPNFGLLEVDRSKPSMPRKVRKSTVAIKAYKNMTISTLDT